MSNVPPPPPADGGEPTPPPSSAYGSSSPAGSPPPPAGASPYGSGTANPYSSAGSDRPKQTLSLIAFILGLVSLVLFSWWGGAVLPGIAAIVLGFIGRAREKGAPKWMWLVGIITGAVSIVITLIILIGAIALVAAGANEYSY
jgi:hypothetical protein